MLTSFFGKSNPINYFIIGILIIIAYTAGVIASESTVITWSSAIQHLFFVLIILFIMLLLDFIIRKNGLTKQNTFGILIFAGFLLYLPGTLMQSDILLASLFLLLALRRILSVFSEKNTEKKLLDASIWIALASFFYFYSLLFFLVIYMVLFRRNNTQFRYYLIPPAGCIAVMLVATGYFILYGELFERISHWKKAISFDFVAYNELPLLIPTALMLTFMLWAGSYRIYKATKISRKERPKYLMMLRILAVSLAISLAAPEKTGAELLFLLVPLAVITANYLEGIDEKVFKESLLWITVGLPIVLLFVL